jgi:hypothetical protein
LVVGHVEGAFFGGAEDGDDASEGGGPLQEGEEVDDEADAGVVGDGCGVMEAFFCV